MTSPTLIVLAGPNGSGKSTLYQTRVAPIFSGPFINADIIQRKELCDNRPEASYHAAKIAETRRGEALSCRIDFVAETVFSHESKVDLIKQARSAGYVIWILHVGVGSPDLSVARVAHRVAAGGHDVPDNKIHDRYHRSAPLIRMAVLMADHGVVYDNSVAGQMPKAIVTFQKGSLLKVRENPPEWIRKIYLQDVAAS